MKPCWVRGQIQCSCKTGDLLRLSWTSNCGRLYNRDVHYLQDCANYIFFYTCLFLRIHVWAIFYCFPASLFIFAFLPLRSKCGLLISVCSHPPPPSHWRGILLVQGKGNIPFPVLSTTPSVNRTCHQHLKSLLKNDWSYHAAPLLQLPDVSRGR